MAMWSMAEEGGHVGMPPAEFGDWRKYGELHLGRDWKARFPT